MSASSMRQGEEATQRFGILVVGWNSEEVRVVVHTVLKNDKSVR